MLRLLHKWSTGRVVILAMMLNVIMMLAIMPESQNYIRKVSPKAEPLDLIIMTYSPETAQEKLATFTDKGLKRYKQVALTADFLYPLVYGIASAVLLAFIGLRIFPDSRSARFIPLIAIGGMTADLLENFTIVSMINTWPDFSTSKAQLAGIFTFLKWSFDLLAIGLIIAGLLILLLKPKKDKED